MKQVILEYGDGVMQVEVPDTATIVRPGVDYTDPPEVDPWEATRQALTNPLGCEPLHRLVHKGSRVVIAFPDRVKGGSHERSHRRVAIPIILEELRKAGVEAKDVKLICAIGLHKKNTRQEMVSYLGHDLVDEFFPDRLVNHDAEDPEGIVQLGRDEMGNSVCVNRDIYEADLAIMIGHTLANPYGGYSGGYKMCVTGVTDWRSIASHHTPSTMHRDDFVPVSTDSLMRKKFDSIGKAMERGMGKKFFVVDAVLGSTSQVLGVYAGLAEDVQRESWKLARQRTEVHLNTTDKFDVMIFGMPRTFHYGPGMGSNPILITQACGSQVARHFDVFRENGVVITTSVCDGWFNDEWFPSYRPIYERLQQMNDFAEAEDMAEEIAMNEEFRYKYRYAWAYHGFHGLSMVSMGAIALKRTSAVVVAGAKAPGYARGMGLVPTSTFRQALKEAEKHVGKNPRVLVLPEAFTKAAVHLKLT